MSTSSYDGRSEFEKVLEQYLLELCGSDQIAEPGFVEGLRQHYVQTNPENAEQLRMEFTLQDKVSEAHEKYVQFCKSGILPAEAAKCIQSEFSMEVWTRLDREFLSAEEELTESNPIGQRDLADFPSRIGRYRLIRVIGKGSFGTVVLAEHEISQGLSAIKILESGSTTVIDSGRYLREIQLMARVSHPNVVQIHDCLEMSKDGKVPDTEDFKRPWFSMEFVAGRALSEQMDKYRYPQLSDESTRFTVPGSITVELWSHLRITWQRFELHWFPVTKHGKALRRQKAQCLELLRQLGSGLDAIHHREIVHRDLKPGNILIQETGRQETIAKISDLGLAKNAELLDQSHSTQPVISSVPSTNWGKLSHSEQTIGTPGYMSPEQESASPSITPAADIFSLSAIAYELVSGQLPWPVDDKQLQNALKSRSLYTGSARSLRHLNPLVSRDLAKIIERGLQKEPASRYPSAKEWKDDLARMSCHLPLQNDKSTIAIGGKWLWRNRVTSLLCLIVTSLLIYGVTLSQKNNELEQNMQEKKILNADLHAANTNLRVSVLEEHKTNEAMETSQLVHFMQSGIQHVQGRQFSKAMTDLEQVPKTRRLWPWHRRMLEASLNSKPKQVFTEHDWGITSLLVSPDERSAITGGQDGRILVWDLAKGSYRELEKGTWWPEYSSWRHGVLPLQTEKDEKKVTHRDCTLAMAWLVPGSTFITGTLRGEVMEWDITNTTSIRRFQHPEKRAINAVASNGKQIICGDSQGKVYLHDSITGATSSHQVGMNEIRFLAWHPQQCWLVVDVRGKSQLLESKLQRVLSELPEIGKTQGATISGDARYLVVAGEKLVILEIGPESVLRETREQYYLPPNTPTSREFQTACFHGTTLLASSDDHGRLIVFERGKQAPYLVVQDQLMSMTPGELRDRLPPSLRRPITGLAALPQGSAVITIGADTAMKKWSLTQEEGKHVLSMGPSPVFHLVPQSKDRIWVGTEDGFVTCWDYVQGKKVLSHQAHDSAVVGIGTLSNEKELCSVDKKGAICFWRWKADLSVELIEKLRHPNPLLTAMVSSDGHWLAAYTEENHLVLWNTRTRQKVADHAVSDTSDKPYLKPTLSFHHRSRYLCATTNGQYLSLMDLEQPSTPPQRLIGTVYGNGGTALAFHPRHDMLLMCGDSMGRLHAFPESVATVLYQGFDNQRSVAGMAYSPEGDCLATMTEDGRVWLLAWQWHGLIDSFTTGISRPCYITFDSSGQRLLIGHENGNLQVWDSLQKEQPVVQSNTSWKVNAQVNLKSGSYFSFDSRGVTIDASGRPHIMGVISPGFDISTQKKWRVLWGYFDDKTWQEIYSAEYWQEKGRAAASGIGGSLRLESMDDSVLGMYFTPWPQAYSEHGRTIGRIWNNSVLGQPFFLSPIGGIGRNPALLTKSKPWKVLHYSFANYGNLGITSELNPNQAEQVGRQGDGIDFACMLDSRNHAHVVFHQKRFESDPWTSPTYLQIDGTTHQVLKRESLPNYNTSAYRHWLLLNSKDEPFVLWEESGNFVGSHIRLAHRTTSGWIVEDVHSNVPKGILSNLAQDHLGNLYLAHELKDHSLLFIHGQPGKWKKERIVIPGVTKESPQHWGMNSLVLTFDRANRPVILVALSTETGNRLLDIRPE